MPATILVVEDHEAVRRALRFWLRVELPHGERSLELARRGGKVQAKIENEDCPSEQGGDT